MQQVEVLICSFLYHREHCFYQVINAVDVRPPELQSLKSLPAISGGHESMKETKQRTHLVKSSTRFSERV